MNVGAALPASWWGARPRKRRNDPRATWQDYREEPPFIGEKGGERAFHFRRGHRIARARSCFLPFSCS